MIESFSKSWDIELFEKENHATGNGFLLCVGSGLLMATMDEIKTVKYAVELTKKNIGNPYFRDFLHIVQMNTDFICVHAWFSITKPETISNLICEINPNKLFIKANYEFGYGKEFRNLKGLSHYLNAFYGKENINIGS